MIKRILYGSVVLAIGIAIGIFAVRVYSGDSALENLRKIKDVFDTANKNYVDEVDTQKLSDAAIKGMLNELDPHSVYIPAKEMVKVEEDFRGSFEGIGVEFDVINDTLTIVAPISGGPSEKLGILASDRILRINDTNCIGIKREDVPKKLRGPKGTHVKVSIRRAGVGELLDFDIERDKIPIYSVDAGFIVEGTDIGYLAINRFAEQTYNEFMDNMDKLQKLGMKRLMLDLRGNPGGYLEQSYRIADEFISGGKKIVYTKGRRPEFDDEYYSTDGGHFEKLPIVVLIGPGSASASEILSGAIQDLDRGLVVGETSFGKGLVQRQFPLGDGSAYRLTISRYYTPSGRCIQRDYTDKEKYYALQGREETKEGDNENHTEVQDTTKKPIFKTAKGRKVVGGGGIVPDYVVKSDTATPLYRQIRAKNVIGEFTNTFLNGKGQSIRSNYKDFASYVKNFKVDAEMVSDMKALAEKKSIKWNEKDFETDESFIEAVIKATIARGIWGNNAFSAVMMKVDKQLLKAETLFDEAKRVAGM